MACVSERAYTGLMKNTYRSTAYSVLILRLCFQCLHVVGVRFGFFSLSIFVFCVISLSLSCVCVRALLSFSAPLSWYNCTGVAGMRLCCFHFCFTYSIFGATLLSCVRLFANCSVVCSFGVASYPIMVSVYGWNVAMMLLSSCKAYLWPKEAIMQTQHIIDFCCTQYTCAIKCTHKLNPHKTSAAAPLMMPVPLPDRHRQSRSLVRILNAKWLYKWASASERHGWALESNAMPTYYEINIYNKLREICAWTGEICMA